MSETQTKDEWMKWRSEKDLEIQLMKIALGKQDSPGEREKPETKETRTPEQITKDNVDHVMDCPNCYPKVKAKVIEREFKDADHQCIGCGLPVKGEQSEKEEWKCPNCGENQARAKD